MDCKEIRNQLLTTYVDDEISDEDRDIVDRHLVECSSCQSFYTEVHGVSFESLNTLGDIKSPKSLDAKIYNLIDSLSANTFSDVVEKIFHEVGKVVFPTPVNALLNAACFAIVVVYCLNLFLGASVETLSYGAFYDESVLSEVSIF